MHSANLQIFKLAIGGGPPPAPLDQITLSAARMLAKERVVEIDGGQDVFANAAG